MIPYTYFIRQRDTGLFYYGSQYNKNATPSALWNTYFTSSKTIKKLIELYGKESFEIQIRRIFDCPQKCLTFENKVIKRLIKHPLCVNGHFGFGVADTNKGRKIKDPVTGLSDYDISAQKMRQTKLTTFNEDGLNIFQQAGKKFSEFNKNNPDAVAKRTQKVMATKCKIGEDGLNAHERGGIKRQGENNSSKRPEVRAAISEGVKKWILENPDLVEENTLKAICSMHKIGEDGLNGHERHAIWMKENNPTANTIWVNNGTINLRVDSDSIPDGFVKGRLGFKMKRKERTCPHCNLTGKGPNMTRYHFENCKIKENNES